MLSYFILSHLRQANYSKIYLVPFPFFLSLPPKTRTCLSTETISCLCFISSVLSVDETLIMVTREAHQTTTLKYVILVQARVPAPIFYFEGKKQPSYQLVDTISRASIQEVLLKPLKAGSRVCIKKQSLTLRAIFNHLGQPQLFLTFSCVDFAYVTFHKRLQ